MQNLRRIAAWTILLIVWARALLLFISVMAARLHASPHLPDLPCNAPLCDFSLFWPASRLGAQAYNPLALQSLRATLFWPQIEPTAFIYPPPALLAIWPLAHTPFEAGFWAWTLALTALSAALLAWAGLRPLAILLTVLSPAALWNVELGQFGLLTAAMLIAGLALAERRPYLAGAILALLFIKPQPGLLAPIAFLARGMWRAILAGAVTGATLAALTLSAFGPAAWTGYLTNGLAMAHYILLLPPPASDGYVQFGVSVFWMARSLHAPLPLCSALQTVTSLAAIIATWFIWRGNKSLTDRIALTIFLALLVTPYGYVDDMVAVSAALILRAQARTWRITVLDAVTFIWPLIGPALFTATGIVFTPVILVLAAWRCAATATPET